MIYESAPYALFGIFIAFLLVSVYFVPKGVIHP